MSFQVGPGDLSGHGLDYDSDSLPDNVVGISSLRCCFSSVRSPAQHRILLSPLSLSESNQQIEQVHQVHVAEHDFASFPIMRKGIASLRCSFAVRHQLNQLTDLRALIFPCSDCISSSF